MSFSSKTYQDVDTNASMLKCLTGIQSLESENAELKKDLEWATSCGTLNDLGRGFTKPWDKVKEIRAKYGFNKEGI